jgi:hypothetical protein
MMVFNFLKRSRVRLSSLHLHVMNDVKLRYFRLSPLLALQAKKYGTQNDDYHRQHNLDDIQNLKTGDIHRQIVNFGARHKWKDLMFLYKKHKREIHSSHIENIYQQLSRMPRIDTQDPKFLRFVDETIYDMERKGLEKVGVPYFMNILYALAKLDLSQTAFGSRMMTELESKDNVSFFFFSTNNVQDVTYCAWACAKLKVHSPKFFQMLDSKAHWLFAIGQPKHVSLCVWSCAKLEIQLPNLFSMLDSKAEWLFQQGNFHDISNIIWSCAKLGIPSPILFQWLDAHATWLFESQEPMIVSNSLWSCAKLNIPAPNLFQCLEFKADWLFENGDPLQIVTCAWACAALGVKSPNLFRLLDINAAWILKSKKDPYILSTCAWACATLGVESPNLFSRLKYHVKAVFEYGNSTNIANLVWALSEQGPLSENILQFVDEKAEWLLSKNDSTPVDLIAQSLLKQNVKNSILLELWKLKNGTK